MTDTTTPRTWTFRVPQHLGFHAELTTICPTWCDGKHRQDVEEHPVDIYHDQTFQGLELEVKADGKAVWSAALQICVTMRPFSVDPAERMPHAIITVDESSETAPLAPDALAEIIDQAAAAVDQMRAAHALLVQALAEYGADVISPDRPPQMPTATTDG
jgi:hypothetical protein